MQIFYQERFLSQDILVERDLPELRKDIKIDMQLGRYYLISGKESIKYSSELEARYLKIWLESELKSVKIPTNKEYLNNIITELEEINNRVRSIIDSYVYSIVDKKSSL